jgi:hypothetical protein
LIVASIDWARGLCRGYFSLFPLYISPFIKYINIFKVVFDVIKSISIKSIGFTASEGNIVITYKEISKNSTIKEFNIIQSLQAYIVGELGTELFFKV